MPAKRQLLQAMEVYQKARMQFVQTVADMALREPAGFGSEPEVMTLLRPLLLDPVPSVQQTAALAIGRLAAASRDIASTVVTSDVLPQVVYSLAEQNRFYKKAAAFVLRSVAKHGADLSQAVVDAGALEALVTCLEEFDPGVKEAGAWALGYIARPTQELAQAVVDAGAVPLLILAVQEPELSLKRVAASAISDIAKHSPELAQSVVDAGAIAYLSQLIDTQDSKLKRQVFSALSQIAKHSVELAEMVVEAEVFPAVFPSLKDSDEYVRKNVACLVRDVSKHTPELASLIVNSGGVAAIVDYVTDSDEVSAMPGVMALGYIACFNERLAMAVIVSQGVPALAEVLQAVVSSLRTADAATREKKEPVVSATAWSLGQIGRHSSEHAKHVAEANVFPLLLAIATNDSTSEDVRTKGSRALKNVLEKCVSLPALEALLADAPPSILQHVVNQFAKILPHDAKARRLFVTSGGLKKVQEINAEPGSQLAEWIEAINGCFPAEIVQYYSPGYSDTLLQRVDEYQPGN